MERPSIHINCIGEILLRLPLKNAIRCRQISHRWKEEFHKTLWKRGEIKVPQTIQDIHLASLKGVHTIDLSNTKVTDKGVKHLKGVHTINLFYTKVTDRGLKHLKGVHTINLAMTKVTDEGLKYLKGVHTINLWNTKVTDKGLKYLKGVHTIFDSYNKYITRRVTHFPTLRYKNSLSE